MRFESTGWAEYSIEDFAAAMDATEKQRANFNNIKRRIIEPAVKELGDKDGWLIHWRPIKAGRKVAAVRFEFRRDPQGGCCEAGSPGKGRKVAADVDRARPDRVVLPVPDELKPPPLPPPVSAEVAEAVAEFFETLDRDRS